MLECSDIFDIVNLFDWLDDRLMGTSLGIKLIPCFYSYARAVDGSVTLDDIQL